MIPRTDERTIHIGMRYDNVSTGQNKKYLKIVDGKDSYSCWEEDLFPRLEKGKTVRCIVEIKGKFINIKDVIDGAALSPSRPAASNTVMMPVISRLEFDALVKRVWTLENRLFDDMNEPTDEYLASIHVRPEDK